MKEHWFHILVALAGDDAHGSAIVRDVLDRTEDRLRLWPATLYGTLDAMVAERLITELTGDERPDGTSERRRYYRITKKGRVALHEEASRLSSMAHAARERLHRV